MRKTVPARHATLNKWCGRWLDIWLQTITQQKTRRDRLGPWDFRKSLRSLSKFALFRWSCVSRWYSSWSLAPCFRRPNWGFMLKMVGWLVGLLVGWWVRELLPGLDRCVGFFRPWCGKTAPGAAVDDARPTIETAYFIWNESNVWSGMICHFMSFQILKKHWIVQSWQVPARLPRFWPAKGHWGPPAGLGASTSPRSPKRLFKKSDQVLVKMGPFLGPLSGLWVMSDTTMTSNSRCWIVTFRPLRLSVGLASVHWRLWQISWVPLVPRNGKNAKISSTKHTASARALWFAQGSGTGILLAEVLPLP